MMELGHEAGPALGAAEQHGFEGAGGYIANRGLGGSTGSEAEEEHHENHDVYAVLLPWFVQALGIICFYILTRRLHGFPYTALLFVLGLFMGYGATVNETQDDVLSQSIRLWLKIDYHVLFAVFLPGLLFKDAFDVNVHLFRASISQLLFLAFPLVLLGSVFTAVVLYYIFPYEKWSFMQCMTLGAILAATDPVAVAALLNEVGAPPRLKVHISGESLLNDGSAVVFFYVFGGIFLHEEGIQGLGGAMGVGEAFKVFFQMSLGGFAVGLAFAMGLVLILYKLNRRMEHEEVVLQVASTVTIAYLCFFTSEILCQMSGVIAVVTCGILTKALANGMISDWQVMSSFWSLLEHLLNTVIFALGGMVFGEILGRDDYVKPKDWGWLILLYIFVNIIRFVLMFAFFPINVRIGLSTNWREVVFASWGGLRGAVGITLALGLDNLVYAQSDDLELRGKTSGLFWAVGGIALLTLVINGTSCGPVLSALGLTDTSESRRKILESAEQATRAHVLDDFLYLMTDERFYFVDFALVVHHCPLLKGLTAHELKTAMEKNKKSVHPSCYRAPHLEHVLPYIEKADSVRAMLCKNFLMENSISTSTTEFSSIPEATESVMEEGIDYFNEEEAPDPIPIPGLVKDTRLMFVELLRAAYTSQIADGELDPRECNGFLVHAFFHSLDLAQDSVTHGGPLNDWDAWLSTPRIVTKADFLARRAVRTCSSCTKVGPEKGEDFVPLWNTNSFEYQELRLNVLRALSFIDAHSEAQERMKDEFGGTTGETAAAFLSVMAESRAEVQQAQEVLTHQNKKKLKHVVSHYLCMILQNKTARYINLLTESGVLLQREARHFLEEIEHSIMEIRECDLDKHPGSIEFRDDDLEIIPDSRRARRGHMAVSLVKRSSRGGLTSNPSSSLNSTNTHRSWVSHT